MKARLTLAVSLFLSAAVFAQQTTPPGQGGSPPNSTQMSVLTARADAAMITLRFEGQNFCATPLVKMSTYSLQITGTPTATSFDALLPAGMAAGTYLTQVSCGTASNLNALIDVTVGTTGPQGPKGDKGDQGLTGPQGPAGAVGPEGPTGPQGQTGAQGATGAQGPAGLEGATGAQGPAGPEGPTGPQGPTGAQGATGAQGPTGPEGATGAQGPAGPEGATGAQGPMGLTGAPGVEGPQGVPGPVGPTGETGAIGPQGQPGPQGPAGLDGATGPAGPQGPNGEPGATGPAGVQGPQGPKGDDGAAGAVGPQGPSGPTGDAGPQGVAGPAGAPGPMGPKGDQGPQGIQGVPGVSLPAGTLLPFAGQNAPAGYLLCDGRAVSRSGYSALFAVIGDLYGAGDLVTTFNLPDLRGRTPVGAGQSPGLSQYPLAGRFGQESYAIQVGHMPPHAHESVLNAQPGYVQFGTGGYGAGISGSSYTSYYHAMTSTVGGGSPLPTLQPSLGVNYIIKH